jgi:hypothetical protein
MATMKHFFQDTELVCIRNIPNAEFAKLFPGVAGKWADSFSKWVGYISKSCSKEEMRPVQRSITYKSFPSKHECNAKCLNGKVDGTCECQCGGKNHGSGNCLNIDLSFLFKEASV